MDSIKSRQLTSYVGKIMNYWASDVLNIAAHKGGRNHTRIDLLGDTIGIEVKGRNRKYCERWAVHTHQYVNFPKQHPEHDLYYAFILYFMKQTAADICTHDTRTISRYMREREMWVVPWSFVDRYVISECKTGNYQNVPKDDFSDLANFEEFYFGSNRVMIPQGTSIADHLHL